MYRHAHYFTRLELVLVVMVLLGVLLVLFVAFLPSPREYAKQINCKQNLKSLGLAGLMYTGDHNGYFPNINNRALGSCGGLFGNWQPLGSRQYIAEYDNLVWACPSIVIVKSDADCSNYRYIGSGLKDDNHNATLVTLGYDASGNHPGNFWMNALFIDGHAEGARPDGMRQVTIVEMVPDLGTRITVSSWNRNDW